LSGPEGVRNNPPSADWRSQQGNADDIKCAFDRFFLIVNLRGQYGKGAKKHKAAGVFINNCAAGSIVAECVKQFFDAENDRRAAG
jgi:hypothetical protein